MQTLKNICKELLIPDQLNSYVWDIDLESLKSNNIDYLFIDLDNTLLSNYQRNISLQHKNWVQKCKDIGFEVFLVSNNRSKKRVQRAAEQLSCHAIYLSMKPFTFGVTQLAEKFNIDLTKTAMIGDQILKDVVVAKWLKMTAILVDPIDKSLPLFHQLQRSFEQYCLKQLSDVS